LFNAKFFASFAFKIRISESGLSQRFTKSCADFLKSMLGIACQKLIAGKPERLALIKKFNHVYVDDCTEVSLPQALADTFPGCGNSLGQPTAGIKTFCRIDVMSGSILKQLLKTIPPQQKRKKKANHKAANHKTTTKKRKSKTTPKKQLNPPKNKEIKP
jgi:hypothetical protein